MIPIEVEVYSLEDPTVKLDVLDGRIKPTYMEELAGPGGGKISFSIHDPKLLANPTLIESRNILKLLDDGRVVGAILINDRSTKIIQDTAAKELYQVSGESLRCWFNDALVYPEGGLRKTSYEERAFNFASTQGEWYDPAQWTTPYNVVNWGDIPGSPWRYAPAFWPDAPNAKWVWSMNSYSSAPAGNNFFRYEFTTLTAGSYSFFFAAADTYDVYVDGQLHASSSKDDTAAWSKVERLDVQLEPGDHIFAVKVENLTVGPAAMIAAIYRAGDATTETPAQLISTTGEAGWKVAGYPDPAPGWSPGEIMRKLLAEAEDRGVNFPLWLNPTFTDTTDSYDNEWDRSLDWSFKIGSSYTSVIDKLEELACDLWIDPDTLDLHMAAERGVDRSVYGLDVDGIGVIRPILVFEKGKNLLQSSIASSGEVKNALMVQTAEGYMAAEDTGDSLGKYGRVEGLLETGASEAVSTAVAGLVFQKKATPETGASYEIIATLGHVPFFDFQVGDWVLAPNEVGLLVKRRIMSLSLQEDSDTGMAVYEAEFDTIFKDNEDRLSRWMAKMGGGSLGGQFSNAGGGSGVPVGVPVIVPPSTPIIQKPNPPENLDASSIGLWEVNGVSAYSQLTLTWDPVTGNTDGSATVPLSYEVWGRLTVESDVTYRRMSLVFGNEATMQPFETGSDWTFKVRAMNDANAVGAFSDEIQHVMEAPNDPMDAPDDPALSSNKGVLIVSWNGLLDGLAPPPQFRYVYASVSDSEFGTYAPMGAALSRDARNIYISGLDVGDEVWVKLRAVDGLDIPGAYSDPVSHTITGIDLGDLDTSISDAIDAANAAALAAASSSNLLLDGSFEDDPLLYWNLETADVTQVTDDPRSGAHSIRIGASSAPYDALTYLLPIPADEAEEFMFSIWLTPETGSSVVEGAIDLVMLYGATETMTDSVVIGSSPEVMAAYTKVSGQFTAPAGARFARPQVVVREDTSGTNGYLVDDASLFKRVPGVLIFDGAISTGHIAAGAVVASNIAANAVAAMHIQAGAIEAGKIAAGAVTANEIAANTIKGNNIEAGTIETIHLSAGVGGELDISANNSVSIIVGNINSLTDGLDATTENLEEMQTYYTFGVDGAVISSPSSPFSVAVRNDRIEMLELGVPVSYWNAGQMFVRSFVGEEVILGNHKLEKYGTGTVVRAL